MKRFHSLVCGVGLLSVSLAPPAPLYGGAIPGSTPPSRIILTWSGDPATTQSVTWRSGTLVPSPRAQLAKFTADPAFESTASTAKGTAATDDLGNGRTTGHYGVDFRGLEPGTRYCYRVGDNQSWSEWNSFRTADNKPAPFRIIYFGDAQSSIHSLWSRAIRSAVLTAPDARFLGHAGDLSAEGYDDRLWKEWTDALGFISATIPSIPVPGNHDEHRSPGQPDSKSGLSGRREKARPGKGVASFELRKQGTASRYVDRAPGAAAAHRGAQR